MSPPGTTLSDSLREWALSQTVFFVASAPLRGRHINISPKGLPESSLAVISPSQVAYLDSIGTGCETISHVRENGRVTMLFCSFDTVPRILRLYCTGAVVEVDDPDYGLWLKTMSGKDLMAARAIIVLNIFKVQLLQPHTKVLHGSQLTTGIG
ncbi:pyridoxamine phosphate oxidase family [Cordyceps militaris]|uniref:Pyridoxamine phosphate oxidase family n=1 Tax=Cordyceps militaris TaxID=73501 RepID=A0A2H4SCD3_CORMI|nr:pyridoxamine phosphate oxidase family [Cordyceps militaris]